MNAEGPVTWQAVTRNLSRKYLVTHKISTRGDVACRQGSASNVPFHERTRMRL